MPVRIVMGVRMRKTVAVRIGTTTVLWSLGGCVNVLAHALKLRERHPY